MIYLLSLFFLPIYIAWRFTSGSYDTGSAAGVIFYISDIAIVIGSILVGYQLSQRIIRRGPLLNELELSENVYPSVDVFITCVNEPFEIITKTISSALELEYPKEKLRILILDDGARDDLQSWVTALAAKNLNYLRREKSKGQPTYYKAGNLNFGLRSKHAEGDLIFLLDSDDRASPSALQEMVPYFLEQDDGNFSDKLNTVGFVQGPNRSWPAGSGNMLADDNSYFHGPNQRGNDGLECVWLVGTAALIQRAALLSAGGFVQGTVVEDIPTGMLMQVKGWSSRFHNNTVTHGVPPVSLHAMLRQRQRWAEGGLQFYFFILPKYFFKLKRGQRFAYIHEFLQLILRTVFLFCGMYLLAFSIIFNLPVLITSDASFPALLIIYILLLRLLRIVGGNSLGARRFLGSELVGIIATIVVVIAAIKLIFVPDKISFWISPKKRDTNSLGSYAILELVMVCPIIIAAIVAFSWIKFEFSQGFFHSLVPFAWQLHFLICFSPVIYYSFVKPEIKKDYFPEPDQMQQSSISKWIFLPTNFAPAATIVSCFITLLEN